MTKVNAEIITVRVIKAQKPYYWYAGHIGETFRVFQHGDLYFIVGYEGVLDVTDCEVVE